MCVYMCVKVCVRERARESKMLPLFQNRTRLTVFWESMGQKGNEEAAKEINIQRDLHLWTWEIEMSTKNIVLIRWQT